MSLYRKWKKYAKEASILVCALFMTLSIGCADRTPAMEQQAAEAEQTHQEPDQVQPDTLLIEVLKVGKADAIILHSGEETMIIDCGEEDDGQEVLERLKADGVQKIDVMIITHFDKDHVGGADTVVDGLPVDRVLLPAYTGAGTEYEDFLAALQRAGIEPENVTETESFTLGGASVTVEPPASYEIPAEENSSGDEEYDNDFSLITTVELGDKRLVFAGDAEKKRIREWLAGGTAQKCDFLKVPHHGVYNKALSELFEALQPAYAVICDSKKNPADERTLELLKNGGTKYFQTMNGDIKILCDGQNIEVSQ